MRTLELNKDTLKYADAEYNISEYGGIRWDPGRNEAFFINRSGQRVGDVVARSVSEYREIEDICVPYWRARNQCIE